MSRLQRTLIEEVRTYAKAQGFDLVIADGVIYSTPTLDITPAILAALQAHAGEAAAALAGASAGDAEPQAPESLSGAGRRSAVRAVMSVSLGELAVRFGCELRGDPDTRMDGVAALGDAHGRAVSFLANSRYRRELAHTRAAAVVLEASFVAECPVASLVSDNPYATYARMAAWLHPEPAAAPGVHPSAIIDAGARVDPSAHVGPYAVIGAAAVIGARAFIGPHCFIAAGVTIAEDVRLVARVTLLRARERSGREC